MKCQRCKKMHNGTFGSGKFCSRSCANSRKKSELLRKELSKKMKGKQRKYYPDFYLPEYDYWVEIKG